MSKRKDKSPLHEGLRAILENKRFLWYALATTSAIGVTAAFSLLPKEQTKVQGPWELLAAWVTVAVSGVALLFIFLTTRTRDYKVTLNLNGENEKDKIFPTTVDKLERLVSSLRLSGSLYLATGTVLTILAAIFLFVTLLKHQQETTVPQLLQYYIPRIAIGLLVEVFAFYFLKLYKENLKRIQYYQNEIITLETKYVALKEAKNLQQSNPNILATVLIEFAKADRNKGLTSEPDGISEKDAIEALVKLIRG